MDQSRKSKKTKESPREEPETLETAEEAREVDEHRPPPSELARLIGAEVGNYWLERLIGSGAHGYVFEARHHRIARRKAVKVLLPSFARDAMMSLRFENEAISATACHHEHIVEVDDSGSFEHEGTRHPFILMELLEGSSLDSALFTAGKEGGMEVARAVRIATQTASALVAAHAHGIIHRDVKPGNIFLTTRLGQSDFVKVLDFGVARLTGELSAGRRTATGVVLGTREYMSPEQAKGHHPDGRTDVFSLGVVLYQMLAGFSPFKDASYSLNAQRVILEEPPRIESKRQGVPRSVQRAVEEAMRKDAGDRPTMPEFLELLVESDAAPRPIADERSLAMSLPRAIAAMKPAVRERPAPEAMPPPSSMEEHAIELSPEESEASALDGETTVPDFRPDRE